MNRRAFYMLQIFVLLFLTVQLNAGTPHLVGGTVTYSGGESVPSGTFTAYITSRPGEVLTQASSGCGFSGGSYYVQVGNFPTAWTAGDELYVEVSDGTCSAPPGYVTLTNAPADQLNFVIVGVPDQPGPISGDAAPCEGTSQTYSISPVSGATSYTWTLPSGWSGSSTTTSITAIAGASGDITVTASSSCGTSTASVLAVIVTTSPDQPGAISGDAAPCEGTSQTYSISPVSGATSYTWTLPSGWSGSSTSTSITATTGASGDITVTANNSCGASSPSTLSVDVSALPNQPGAISGNDAPCEGSSETYSISAVAGATSYTWTLPSGWSGSSTSTSITTTVGAGEGSVSVTANNACGSSSASTLAVSVGVTPDQPGAISGDDTPCQGSSQTYSISAVPGATSYTWTLPSGWSGSSTSTSITATTGTSGDISVTANSSCGSSSASVLAVVVTALPDQPGAISGDEAPCEGSSQTYSISPVAGATSYTWTLPSGWSGSSTSTSITATAGASGDISVSANNTCGSSSASVLPVVVTAIPGQPGAISGDDAPCQGSSQTYSISEVPGATSYTWTLPAGWTGSSTSNSITTTVGITAGTISVTASNSCGTSSPSTLAVAASVTPDQPGAISGDDNPCEGSSQTYSISAVAGASSYTWTMPSGWSGSSTSTSITAIAGASGDISVTANNACGSSSASVLAVVVTPLPDQPGAISGDDAPCEGSSQTYSISPVAGAASYTWTLPSGWSGSSTTTSITAIVGASGDITVTANNTCGASSPSTLAVNVGVIPDQPGAISGDEAPCEGSSQTYSISAVAGATSYTWTLPAGWTGTSTTNSITTSVGASGGTISVAASNSCGTSSPANLAVSVSVAPDQPGAISGDVAPCEGSSQTYSISAVAGATSYTWTLPSGWSGTSTTTSITAIAGASGDISVTANNSCGTSSPGILPVVVTALPDQPGSISGNAAPCQGSSETYSISAVAGATSYTWTLPSGWTGSSTSTSITATAGASGDISVTANNTCGSSSPSTLAVSVGVTPDQPGAISGDIAPCEGSSQTYSISAVPGATTYTWTLPAGWTGSSTSNSITTSVGASGGTISVTASNTCGTSSASTLAVTVSAAPDQPGAISGDAAPCEGTSQTYSISAVPGATSYTWTLPSGWSGTSTTTSITAIAGASGDISVTADNSCGASSPSTLALVVTALPDPPGAISGDDAPCEGSSQTYSISPVNGATSYTWTLPAGWTGTSTTTSITAIAGSSGNISVTANNTCGASSPSTLAVNVGVTPDQPGAISGDETPCQGSTETYSVAAVPGATSYTWSLPAGWSGSSTTNSISTTVGTSGGTISVTASNTCGTSSPVSLTVTVAAIPDAPTVGTITQPTCAVATGSVQLTGLPASGTWILNQTPGGLISGTGTTTTISGLSTGSYTYTVTNANGCTSEASDAVVIDANPETPATPVIGDISQPTCDVATGSIQLTSLPSTGTWTITQTPGGTITGTGTSYTISGLGAGSYSFTVTNANGCTSEASDAVVINPQPETPTAPVVGEITQPTCTVATGSVLLSGLPASGTWTITQTPGGTITGTGTSFTITGLGAGTYTFSVTNEDGCVSDDSEEVVINANPGTPDSPVVGTITQPTCTVATGSVELSGLPSSGSWNINQIPGGTIPGNGTTALVADLVEGSYTFTVTDDKGCISEPSAEVIINAQPETPSAPVVGTITQPDCDEATGSVVLESLPDAGTWTINPGGITGTGTSTTVTGLASGTHSFTVTNNLGCISDASADVVINDQPATPATPTITLDGYILHSDATEGNQWYDQDGIIDGATDQNYTATATGDYYVIVTVGECSSEPSNTINVVINTGIENSELSSLMKVYPNPVTDELFIEFEDKSTTVQFEIINSTGGVVHNGQFIEKTSVSTSMLSTGFYLIKIENGETFGFKKIVKE